MVVGAKVCDLTEDLLWFVCGLYVGILTSSLSDINTNSLMSYCINSWTKGEYMPVYIHY